MPASTLVANLALDYALSGGVWTPPTDLYLGLIMVQPWAPGAELSGGTIVVPSNFATLDDSPRNPHHFRVTTAGTSGDEEPTWNTAAGATTTDGTAVLTESSALYAAGSVDGCEPADDAYERWHFTLDQGVFAAASGGAKWNDAEVEFPMSEVKWGQIGGGFVTTEAELGNLQFWGPSRRLIDVGSGGITPRFQASTIQLGITLTL